jgi:multidrug efflux pump subunit AcrA (membrane-fusion protein)
MPSRIHLHSSVLGVGAVLLLAASFHSGLRGTAGQLLAADNAVVAPQGVACLGRISPRNGITSLSPAASSYPSLSPVAALNVREGEQVTAGQVLARLLAQIKSARP